MWELTLLEIASGLSNLLPVLFGCYFYRRLDLTLKIFLAFTALLLIADIAGLYLATHGRNNLWLYAILTLAEYSLLMMVLARWQTRRSVRIGLLCLIPVFWVIWMGAKLSVEPLNMGDFFTAPLANAFIMGGVLYTLYTLSHTQVGDLLKEHRFWILTGLLLYYGGNIFNYALIELIVVWSIHNVLNIIANILYSGGFLSLRHSHSGGRLSSGHLPS